MTKYVVLSVATLVFVISFYYGKSTIPPVLIETTSEKELSKSADISKKLPTKQVFTGIKSIEKEKSKQEIKTNLIFLEKKERYKLLAGFAKIEKAGHPLIDAIIGLENPDEIDHQTMINLNNQLQDYIKENPEMAFKEIKDLLNSFMAKEDPSLRANLLVTISFVPGKENETKEMALSELENNRIPEDYFDFSSGRTLSQSKKSSGEDIAVVMAYNAFLSASHKDPSNIDAKTFEILKKQPNIDIRRMIALTYHRAFPTRGPAMLKKLREEKINVFPDNFVLNP
jgi:hypothetical protein